MVFVVFLMFVSVAGVGLLIWIWLDNARSNVYWLTDYLHRLRRRYLVRQLSAENPQALLAEWKHHGIRPELAIAVQQALLPSASSQLLMLPSHNLATSLRLTDDEIKTGLATLAQQYDTWYPKLLQAYKTGHLITALDLCKLLEAK